MIGIGFNYPLQRSYNNIVHNKYLDIKDRTDLNVEIKNLFDISYKILCPSLFVFNKIKKIYDNNNLTLCQWSDYDLSNTNNIKICRNYIINSTINIAFFNESTICKGKEQLVYLQNKFIQYKNFNNKVFNCWCEYSKI